jgi:hypothetical protein
VKESNEKIQYLLQLYSTLSRREQMSTAGNGIDGKIQIYFNFQCTHPLTLTALQKRSLVHFWM